MGDKSKIEWTDATWNPVRGCSVVSEGCRNCYAMLVAARFSGEGMPYEGLAYRNGSGPHWTGKIRLVEEHLEDPLRWKKPRRVFVNSMSDLFHEALEDHEIAQVFAVMACAQQHVFQVLTKRPARMAMLIRSVEFAEMVNAFSEELAFDNSDSYARRRDDYRAIARSMNDADPCDDDPLPNVWLGVSCEDQKTADERIPLLLQTPAAVRWVSAEPLLGPINIARVLLTHKLVQPQPHGVGPEGFTLPAALAWVVCGGESGPKARPMHPDWARSLRDQCRDPHLGPISFFFKQWGHWLPGDGDGKGPAVWQDGNRGIHPLAERESVTYHKFGELGVPGSFALKVGKKAAGRLLDGRTWDEFPEAKATTA